MKSIMSKYRKNGLFTIIFVLSVCIITVVSIAITWTTIRMAEQFFIEKYSINNSKVIGKIKDNFDSFNYSTILTMNTIQQSGNIGKVLSEEQTTLQKMNNIHDISQQMAYAKSILSAYDLSITLIGSNGFSYSTNRQYWPITDEELSKSALISKTIAEPKQIHYQSDRREVLGDGDKSTAVPYVVITKSIMNRFTNQVYGSLLVSMKDTEFRKLYENYTNDGSNIFIVNKSGEIISSNVDKYIGTKRTEFLRFAEEFETESPLYLQEEVMGKEQIIIMEYLPFVDMYLFNVIDKDIAIQGVINKKDIFIVSIIIVLIALLIVFLVTRKVTNSLSNLVKQISKTSKHNFDQYVSVSGLYETRQIGIVFNNMLDELQVYINQLMLIQQQKREGELTALQRQISPHFLYNTLTAIKFLVQQGKKEEATESIHSLISLMQLSLGDMNEVISIEQEVKGLKSYVQINQKRYGDRIRVNFFVTPECMECQIPKLILQPFVENSFAHAFNRKTDGYIHIFIWCDKDRLVCEIVDNGDGIDFSGKQNNPSINKNKHFFSGVGIENVRERIKLIYGEDYEVKIDSKLDEGTRVVITLPNKKI